MKEYIDSLEKFLSEKAEKSYKKSIKKPKYNHWSLKYFDIKRN